MSDARLQKLGEYFVHFNVHKRFGITFEKFVWLNEQGLWKEWVG